MDHADGGRVISVVEVGLIGGSKTRSVVVVVLGGL